MSNRGWQSIDLSVRMGSVTFKNPFIVGSGPTVKNVEQIKEAQDNGWAGASLKLAIEPFPYLNFPPPVPLVPKGAVPYLHRREAVDCFGGT